MIGWLARVLVPARRDGYGESPRIVAIPARRDQNAGYPRSHALRGIAGRTLQRHERLHSMTSFVPNGLGSAIRFPTPFDGPAVRLACWISRCNHAGFVSAPDAHRGGNELSPSPPILPRGTIMPLSRPLRELPPMKPDQANQSAPFPTKRSRPKSLSGHGKRSMRKNFWHRFARSRRRAAWHWNRSSPRSRRGRAASERGRDRTGARPSVVLRASSAAPARLNGHGPRARRRGGVLSRR